MSILIVWYDCWWFVYLFAYQIFHFFTNYAIQNVRLYILLYPIQYNKLQYNTIRWVLLFTVYSLYKICFFSSSDISFAHIIFQIQVGSIQWEVLVSRCHVYIWVYVFILLFHSLLSTCSFLLSICSALSTVLSHLYFFCAN